MEVVKVIDALIVPVCITALRQVHAVYYRYIAHVCALILRHTSLLPHVNAGVVSWAELSALREVSVSAGLMLESTSDKLLQPGRAHYDCPDKVPAARLQTIRDAGGRSLLSTCTDTSDMHCCVDSCMQSSLHQAPGNWSEVHILLRSSVSMHVQAGCVCPSRLDCLLE